MSERSPSPRRPRLVVDLARVRGNYRVLAARHAAGRIGAVVKADAYGLGMVPVARALRDGEGCRDFFVATLGEAVALRDALDDAAIYVFQGLLRGEEAIFRAHRLRPVLNDPGQLARWSRSGGGPSALHVDTGMCRLGLSLEEFAALPDAAEAARAAGVELVMSHLASACDPADPQNALQLERFRRVRERLPGIPASLANSSGHFLGEAFHFDLGRPGCALYGIAPDGARANPVENVAEWRAPILQVRRLAREETIGYGATVRMPAGTRTATLAAGYADGIHRQASHRLPARIGGVLCPMLGRVSMDVTCYDVTEVPEALLEAAGEAVLMDDARPVDALAESYGTIGYEVLTSIGPRVMREYLGG